MTNQARSIEEIIAYRKKLVRDIRDLEIQMSLKSGEAFPLRKQLLNIEHELVRMRDHLFILNEELAKVLERINGHSESKPNG